MSALFADPEAAQAGLSLLNYLSDLFTAARKEEFSKVDVLMILNMVRTDTDLFEPEAVIAYEIATAEIDQEAEL